MTARASVIAPVDFADVAERALRGGLAARPRVSAPARSKHGIGLISVFDEFTSSCFADAVRLWPIGPVKPELDLDALIGLGARALVVESAWNGNDGRWRYLLTGSKGPREQLRSLVAECRRRGIPTVFWNKEDPVHFDDFIETAQLFDHVFTTDGDLLDRYRERLPATTSVALMRFSAAPAIHNPRRVDGHRRGGIAFAGQYFRHKYPERRAQMDVLFAAAAMHEFAIFSRMLGGAPEYQFPAEYERFVRGSLPYSRMVDEYKRHRVFLNVNSVVGSRTMCARRVFELAACKTIVVSMHSDAVRSVFSADEVPTVGSRDEAADVFARLVEDDFERRATAQRAWRRAGRDHTIHDRVAQIAGLLGEARGRPAASFELHVRGETVTAELLADLARQSLAAPAARAGMRAAGTTVRLVVHGEAPAARSVPGVRVLSPAEAAADRARDEAESSTRRFTGVVSGGSRYGRHYLEDLHLQLTRFQDEPIAAKTAPEGPLDREESAVERVRADGWLARADEPWAEALIGASLGAAPRTEIAAPAPAYAADPLDYASPEQARTDRWEA